MARPARAASALAAALFVALPATALACPACAAGGVGADPPVARLVAEFIALPFALVALLALAARVLVRPGPRRDHSASERT